MQLTAVEDPNDVFGNWDEFLGGEYVPLSHFNDTGTISFSDSSAPGRLVSGQGIYGLEASLDRLPTGTVSYSGEFTTTGYVSDLSVPVAGSTEGTMTMVLIFSAGSVSGTTAGDIAYVTGSILATDSG